jgi:ABC-type lipoprotein export system ATPase subunit
MTDVLQLVDVHKTYPGRDGPVRVLAGIDLEIRSGEVVWLRGPSGSGKTTLLAIAGLLAPPTCGEVHIGGEPVIGLSSARSAAFRARSLGFVFQQHNLIGHLTAVENIVLPAIAPRRSAEVKAREMLAELGLTHRRTS